MYRRGYTLTFLFRLTQLIVLNGVKQEKTDLCTATRRMFVL